MGIFLGTAGLPGSAKGSSTIEGLKEVATLGLNAMEIEFVRSIYLKEKPAQEVGELAKSLGIRLSVHAPYYINLCSKDDQVVQASRMRILNTALIGEIMGADAVAIHAAYYSSDNTFDMLVYHFQHLLDSMKAGSMNKIKLGVEVMGREKMFGDLDEVVRLCKEVNSKQIVPYIDFGHLYVRGKGKIDYAEIFDTLKPLKLDHINSHFEGVAKNKKGEFVDVHEPVGKHPPFEPLAEEIIKRKLDITIISESPILEIDSLKMKQTFEHLGYNGFG